MSQELSEAEVLAQAMTKATPEQKVDEIEILFESTKTYNIGSETLTIRPFSFGELPQVISLLKGVGSHFAHYQALGTLNTVEAMMDVIAAGGENLIQTMSLNTRKPRAFFDTIAPDVGVMIMQDFLMMNIGFFTKRVLPVIKGIH